jgi:hypothetical protein
MSCARSACALPQHAALCIVYSSRGIWGCAPHDLAWDVPMSGVCYTCTDCAVCSVQQRCYGIYAWHAPHDLAWDVPMSKVGVPYACTISKQHHAAMVQCIQHHGAPYATKLNVSLVPHTSCCCSAFRLPAVAAVQWAVLPRGGLPAGQGASSRAGPAQPEALQGHGRCSSKQRQQRQQRQQWCWCCVSSAGAGSRGSGGWWLVGLSLWLAQQLM